MGYISNQPARAGSAVELAFHSDMAFSPEPFLGIPCTPSSSRTSAPRPSSSTPASYRALPEANKSRLQGMKRLHVFAGT